MHDRLQSFIFGQVPDQRWGTMGRAVHQFSRWDVLPPAASCSSCSRPPAPALPSGVQAGVEKGQPVESVSTERLHAPTHQQTEFFLDMVDARKTNQNMSHDPCHYSERTHSKTETASLEMIPYPLISERRSPITYSPCFVHAREPIQSSNPRSEDARPCRT